MSVLDRAVLAERTMAVQRHLARVADQAGSQRHVDHDLVARAYESLDLKRVHRAAADGPADLLKFLARLKDHAR